MSDTEMKPSTSVDDKPEKKFINKQTQHGSAETADEENIVVLATIFAPSPIRITEDDEAVWLEEFDPKDVSLTLSRISNYFQKPAWRTRSHKKNARRVQTSVRKD